jgi:hypothetical protein
MSEHDDYVDDSSPLELPSLRAFLILLLVLAILAATWFYFAVLLPAQGV